MSKTHKIDSFQGEYYFLSNFYTAPITFKGIEYKTTEAAFQASKSIDELDWYHIAGLETPGRAKRAGQRVRLRDDWDNVKDAIMYGLCLLKFSNHKVLRKKLIDTEDAILIEGNNWDDKYWGVCEGEGKNKLGEILMRVRKELQ